MCNNKKFNELTKLYFQKLFKTFQIKFIFKKIKICNPKFFVYAGTSEN